MHRDIRMYIYENVQFIRIHVLLFLNQLFPSLAII